MIKTVTLKADSFYIATMEMFDRTGRVKVYGWTTPTGTVGIFYHDGAGCYILTHIASGCRFAACKHFQDAKDIALAVEGLMPAEGEFGVMPEIEGDVLKVKEILYSERFKYVWH